MTLLNMLDAGMLHLNNLYSNRERNFVNSVLIDVRRTIWLPDTVVGIAFKSSGEQI